MGLLDQLFGGGAPVAPGAPGAPDASSFNDRLMSPMAQMGLALLANHGTLRSERGMFDGVNDAGLKAHAFGEKRREKAFEKAEKNKTLEFLRKNHPDIAGYVDAGMPVAEAFTYALRKTDMEADNARADAAAKAGDGSMTAAMRNWQYAQNNPDFARYLGVGASGAQYGDAPSGYRFTDAGDLAFIPGGPADPAMKGGSGAGSGAVGEGMKLTEGQSKDLNYYQRGAAALPTIEENQEALTSRSERLADRVPLIGNSMTSSEYQVANQAGREFLAAILRKDTGAAITREEFEIYGPMFLPQPGDQPAVLEQKRVARSRALEAMRLGLGTATPLADAPVSQNPTSGSSGREDPLGLR